MGSEERNHPMELSVVAGVGSEVGMSRGDALQWLRRLSDDGSRAVRYDDLPRRLRLMLQQHFGSVAAAREAAGIPHPVGNRVWNRDRVIQQLQLLAAQGVRMTKRELMNQGRSDVIWASMSLFGSFATAREAAGIAAPKPRRRQHATEWNADLVLKQIRILAERGQSLAATKVHHTLWSAGERYFGSWGAAVDAAGFDYESVRMRPRFSRDGVCVELRRLAKRAPSLQMADLRGMRVYSEAMAHFGSFEAALRAADLNGWPLANNHDSDNVWSADKVIERLKNLAAEGIEIRARKLPATLSAACRRYFGSVRKARVAAGLDNRAWTKAKVIAAIQSLASDGQSLTTKTAGNRLTVAARRQFGSWSKACRAAGVRVNGVSEPWTRDRIVTALRDYGRKHPRITVRLIGYKLRDAAVREFGSLAAACDAAGVPLRGK